MMDETLTCDVLILGSGGAGLMAALHAYDTDPRLHIVLVAKGLVGKSGCTRLVQGGFNAVLHPADSVELHFRDTIRGGQFLNNQELAWELVTGAPRVIHELETKVGCFFDRGPDGRIHQKPFAGQSFDRTVHRGDLTGIEIVSRLHDQLFARGITFLDETRAVALVPAPAGDRIAGVLLLDQRSGRFTLARAKVVVLATGGGPRMYKYSAPALEKTGDGYALAYRAGAVLIDMEMMQFHPTGLLAGASRLSGMVLEEGLRGAGGRLYNAQGERFMARYDPERLERSTRDVVARASYLEIMAGRGTPAGGVLLDVSHLGAEFVRRSFPGMVRRCAEVGYDLTRGPVEVTPTAHFHMGGVKIDRHCRCNLPGLLVAGEDAGGIHGANRLGGNGVADSTVFGARAGETAAALCAELPLATVDLAAARAAQETALRPLGREGENPFALRDALQTVMWERVGLARDAAGLRVALATLAELAERAERTGVRGGPRWNLAWQQALDVQNLVLVARLTAAAALYREESRGSHYRRDFPARDDARWLVNVHQQQQGTAERIWDEPVALTRLRPESEVAVR
ncbi:MAG: FAD-binding protein [Chloroflexi bacterium]|nr:FAD-binding protein [Chloroflexota bacterium]